MLLLPSDPQLEVMQRGFVRYIQRGGTCDNEPAGLMGAVIHSPFLLGYHFLRRCSVQHEVIARPVLELAVPTCDC